MIMPSWADYGTYDGSYYPELWDGCVGAWCPSLGPTGASFVDISRSQNHGRRTDNGLITYTMSDGYAFQTINSTTCINTNSPIINQYEKTVSLWIFCTTISGQNGFIGNRSGSGSGWGFGLNIAENKKLFYYHTGVAVIYGTTELISSRWYHVAITADFNSKNIIIYLNGRYDNNGTLSAYGISIYNDTIGSETPGSYMNGYIDDIRIYNKVLSPDAIKQLSIRRGISYIPRRRQLTRLYSQQQLFNPAWANYSNSQIGLR